MPENPGIKHAHSNACSKSSRLSNCDTMIFFPSQLRVNDTCRRPLTRLCASGGRNFCKPSNKHVCILKDGLNGPSECDRASFTTRKKSDVISPVQWKVKRKRKKKWVFSSINQRMHHAKEKKKQQRFIDMTVALIYNCRKMSSVFASICCRCCCCSTLAAIL